MFDIHAVISATRRGLHCAVPAGPRSRDTQGGVSTAGRARALRGGLHTHVPALLNKLTGGGERGRVEDTGRRMVLRVLVKKLTFLFRLRICI